jgi:hypothetical protein
MLRCMPVIALLIVFTGCTSSTETRLDDRCPQTYEHGNHGCAVLAISPGSLPADAPSRYRWKISALGTGTETFDAGMNSLPGEVHLRLTLRTPLPAGSDTATVMIVGEVRDDTGPIVLGVPLPLFAVDTARQALRFAAVGERPNIYKVDLDLRRVAP